MIVGVEQAAQAAGKRLGAIPTPGRSVEELVAAGYDLIVVDADVLLLRDAASASLAKLRAEI
jgi:2-keto-3-deoxy-L-rhamnonate aldolase RhmA